MDSESRERRSGRPDHAQTSSGDKAVSSPSRSADADNAPTEAGEQSGPIPEMVRKALAMGLAGFFTTEQTIRKALGDTLPQEWIDFVADQSNRTRGDFTEAIASEVGRTLRAIDLTKVADQLLTGRTIEVSARIRLLPVDDEEEESEGNDS